MQGSTCGVHTRALLRAFSAGSNASATFRLSRRCRNFMLLLFNLFQHRFFLGYVMQFLSNYKHGIVYTLHWKIMFSCTFFENICITLMFFLLTGPQSCESYVQIVHVSSLEFLPAHLHYFNVLTDNLRVVSLMFKLVLTLVHVSSLEFLRAHNMFINFILFFFLT